MSKKGKAALVPKFRFKGFIGTWEQRKLGEITVWKKGQGLPKSVLNKEGNGHPVIHYADLYKFGAVEENVHNWSTSDDGIVIPDNSILFPSSDVTPNGLARTTTVLMKNVKAGGDVLIGELDNTTQAVFCSYQINAKSSRILPLITGTTIKHINSDALSTLSFFIPTVPEQTAIGNFFRNLDELINVENKKLELLKKHKKGLLQKMFPAESKTTPRIRFKGYTDAWKKRKLGDVCEIVGGGTPNTITPEYWDGDIDWYLPTEIGKQIYAYSSQRKITKLGLKASSAKILPADRTILFTSRATIGDMAILKKPAATNQGFQSLVVKEDFNVYFVFLLGNKIKEYALKNAVGSTFLEISGKNLSKMRLYIPSLSEQTNIGNFFCSLDELIIAQSKKIEFLKVHKKGLMQGLFPSIEGVGE